MDDILELTTEESLHFALRTGVAAVGGFLVGFERDIKGKTAGMRTNILVAMGAALFVLVALHLDDSDTDFMRVLGQVVTGVGFLGAGAIIQRKDKIKGITTAATIWCSAGIGCLAAASMFAQLVIFVFFAVVVNVVFGIISIGERKDHMN